MVTSKSLNTYRPHQIVPRLFAVLIIIRNWYFSHLCYFYFFQIEYQILPFSGTCPHLKTLMDVFFFSSTYRQCGRTISTGFDRLMFSGPHWITGEISVLSGVSGKSRNKKVSSYTTPKKNVWETPSGTTPLSMMMATFESGWLNVPPLLLNKFSAYVVNWGYNLMRESSSYLDICECSWMSLVIPSLISVSIGLKLKVQIKFECTFWSKTITKEVWQYGPCQH